MRYSILTYDSETGQLEESGCATGIVTTTPWPWPLSWPMLSPGCATSGGGAELGGGGMPVAAAFEGAFEVAAAATAAAALAAATSGSESPSPEAVQRQYVVRCVRSSVPLRIR